MKNHIEIVQKIRQLMSKKGIDAIIIPSSDPHQSEYVAPRWQSRAWVSGFTGSAGTLVLTKDYGGLWTDSRYFLQANQQLDSAIFKLHKIFDRTSENYFKWLSNHLPAGSTVAFDGTLFSKSMIEGFKKLAIQAELKLRTDDDLMDQIWEDRPARPKNEIFAFDTKYTGQSRVEKIELIKAEMDDLKLDHYLISSLDDIAWLLNIRSNDIKFNPVCLCYFLISNGEKYLFIDKEKINAVMQAALDRDGIQVSAYDDIFKKLSQIKNGRFGIDPSTNSYSIYNSINIEIKHLTDLTSLKKASKNDVEISHIKNAMRKDGVALLKSFMWLESQLSQNLSVTECALAEKIKSFRSQQQNYFGESFDAIVGYKSNGAIIHYKPEIETCSTIKNEGVLLVDCGAQFFDGTTDITRTFCFSEPTEDFIEAYTAVLKGHIGLATAKFPKGTRGAQLDSFARQALWDKGLNFMHGTGHGVGFFLNVHEKPQGISAFKSLRNEIPFLSGMITSNEPGYYKEGAYGIRIENLFLTKPAEEDGFLKNETVTYFPIETKMIDVSALLPSEIKWLNDYHKLVFEKLSPGLDGIETAWLKEKCAEI